MVPKSGSASEPLTQSEDLTAPFRRLTPVFLSNSGDLAGLETPIIELKPALLKLNVHMRTLLNSDCDSVGLRGA